MDMIHTKIVTSQVKMWPTEEADFSACDIELCVSNVDDNLGYTIHNIQVFSVTYVRGMLTAVLRIIIIINQ